MEKPNISDLGYGPEYWNVVNPILDAYEAMSPQDVLTVFNAHYATDDDYTEALEHLPARNPEHAAATYRAFAESPDPDVRGRIIMYLTHLSLVDRAAGLELWDHLIRDPHDGIREEAIAKIDQHLEGVEPSLDPAEQAEDERRRREDIGLTWQDIAHLYRAHRSSGDRLTRYQPGGGSPHGA